MKTKSVEELADFKTRFKESSIHMIIHIVVWAFAVYTILFLINDDIVYTALGLLSFAAFIFMITRNVKYEHLIVYSWICLVCVMLCGIAVGRFIGIERMLPTVIGVCIVDVFSFTRFGKKTANARLISSPKWLPRLLVYGRSFKTGKPVATKGFGDYLWYSITLAAIYATYGKEAGLFAIIAIILGVIINLIIINRIYKFSWYIGFPATVGPLGLCTILVLIVYI